MDVQPFFSQTYRDRMRAAGYWPDLTLTECLDRAVAKHSGKVAIRDVNNMTGQQTTLTFAELAGRVRLIALGLHRLGIRRGDVVSYQLPNWWEFAALHLACLRIGAVTNPLMPIFREHELKFMLGLAESKVFVVPRIFRGFDYPAMAADLQRALPSLAHVIVIGGDGASSFETTLLDPNVPGDADALFAANEPDPDDIVELVYTSGTTGEPKGAMQTSNVMFSNIVAYAERVGLTGDDVLLMASPMAHQTGFLYGFMMGIYLGATTVYQDVWNPVLAADLIEAEGISFTMGSTPFLADLTDMAEKRPEAMTTLRLFVAGGAPIPRALVRRSIEKLGAKVLSGWGMTENGAVTITPADAPEEKVFETDGLPLAGVKLRILDAAGNVLPTGEEGRLQAQACSMFAGYYKRAHLNSIDKDNWFETGDLARLDADGYVRITGRSKDIIIRGGENVPVVEVENLLFKHPDVQEVAIVGMPDDRLGERACAFVVTKDAKAMTLSDVVAFLQEHKLSRNYLPERVEVLAAFPRTPSGKIQKFKLREMAASLRDP
jgi:cyclohexanecarboxylate-CoA ligase